MTKQREDGSWHPLVARLYDPIMSLPEQFMLSDHRSALVSGLKGEVVDLGAGTGALFPYFDRLDDERTQVTAVEPDPNMRAQARERAEDFPIEIDFSKASGEDLPFDDNTFDAVCASFVFCTIPDHERALSEVARVLKPGGEFRFLEHVRGDGTVGAIHDAVAPGWHAVAGGCHLTRETGQLFLNDDRFRTRKFERTGGLSGRFLPVVRGRLERKRDSRLPGPLASIVNN